VSLAGALAGGLVGTLVLSTGLRAASELGLTRIDLPFLLGTAFTEDRRRAKVLGWAAHVVAGLGFAVVYWAVFTALDRSGWWLGALFGLLHGLVAGTALVNVVLPVVNPRMGTPFTTAAETPLLEPPGFLMLNYGPRTPVVTIALHVVYGALVGGFHALSG
jgi:hypothetical protein